MALISRDSLLEALGEMGRLAIANGQHIELLIVGGGAMALAFDARRVTQDVDVVVLAPADTRLVRAWAAQVAETHDWPVDWLNEGAKGYLMGISEGPIVVAEPGIVVRLPTTAQLLAMKLSAWRDKVDTADAQQLLKALAPDSYETAWAMLQPYLLPGRELKAQYAFADLWELIYGNGG